MKNKIKLFKIKKRRMNRSFYQLKDFAIILLNSKIRGRECRRNISKLQLKAIKNI